MAIGDDAQAAGMPLVPNSGAAGSPGKAKQGPQEFNRDRDFIAQGPENWKPGVVVPVTQGGTGAASAAGARTALGLEKSTSSVDAEGKVATYNAAGQLAVGDPTRNGQAATKRYVDQQIAGIDIPDAPEFNGGTVTGQVLLPNSYAAGSGYVVSYINGDGRISRGASSERYKDDIDRAPTVPDVLAVPIASYVMKDDPERVTRYGPIAEDLADHEATAGLVVYDVDGSPQSFDQISYLMAVVAQLHARVRDLESAA